MMLVQAVALLAGASASPASAGSNSLPQVFVSACLDGQARLTPGKATRVGFQQLPPALREELGKPDSSQVWQLDGSGSAFLYLLSYDDARRQSPRICGLASEDMDLATAAGALESRITGGAPTRKLGGTEWLRPQDGYVAIATTANRFKVVQVNWLSEEQRARMLKAVRSLPQ